MNYTDEELDWILSTKYTDEELSRILSAHCGGQLELCGIDEVAFSTSAFEYRAFSRNQSNRWHYLSTWTTDEFLHELEKRGWA